LFSLQIALSQVSEWTPLLKLCIYKIIAFQLEDIQMFRFLQLGQFPV